MKMLKTKFKKVLLVLTFLQLIHYGDSYRILGLFPYKIHSHFQFFRPVLQSLAEAGHELVVVSHFPEENKTSNYRDEVLSGMQSMTGAFGFDMFANRPWYGLVLEFFQFSKFAEDNCINTLKNKAIDKVIREGLDKPFDVIITEQWIDDCMMGVFHKLNIPVIGLSSCALMPWLHDRVGAPIIPSYLPSTFIQSSQKMSFPERFENWWKIHVTKLMHDFLTKPRIDKLLREHYGQDIPKSADLVKEISLIFVNQHHSLSLPKPLPPSVIEIGGVHLDQKRKPLDLEMKKLLDSANDGVIYISWGSMLRSDSLPYQKREALVNALRRLNQLVLWKWENETMPNQPKNVILKKWMQQQEILCHPNVKVFVTHGGLLGSSEAAYCGIPVVVTPMYGDQFSNAAALVARGFGHLLEYNDFSENQIYDAIQKALRPESAANAKKVSFSFNNRPISAKETVVWWTEHVIKTKGAPFTKSEATFMPWYSYYCLDIYLLIVSVLSLNLYLWVKLLQNGKRKLFGVKHEKTE